MLPSIPENRHCDSVQKAVAIFDHHTQRRRFKLFNQKPSILKNPQSDRRKGDRGAKISGPASILIVANNSTTKKPITGRVGLLLILLVLIYSQYHFVFSGQEKLHKSTPYFYTQMPAKVEGMIGPVNVRGNTPSENSRLY